MSRRKRNKARNRPGASPPAESVRALEYAAAVAIGLLAFMHMASVAVHFQLSAGLHRWLMTYANGFHRRGLVGSVFQFFYGDMPRDAQIAAASWVSSAATYLWLLASLALFFSVVFRLRERALRLIALAFGALAFLNPMWTLRAFDNGYTDWLAGLAVVGALAAFLCKRPVTAGLVVSLGIIGYWGTVFVWLPLGWLIALLIARDALSSDRSSGGWRDMARDALRRLRAMLMHSNAPALYLPLAAAALCALANDNAAAIAELQRIGGQQHIIDQTFRGIGGAVAGNIGIMLLAPHTLFAVWGLYALPPLLASCCLVGALRLRGMRMFRAGAADFTAGAVAALLPLLFLLPAFDWARLTLWTYTGFFTFAVVYLACAQPAGADGGARRGAGALPAVPLVMALFSLATPPIYVWYDNNYPLPCKRFCFMQRGPQAEWLDAYRRRFISSPIDEYTAPGAMTTSPRELHSEGGARIVREGRDAAGAVMSIWIDLLHKAEGVSVRGRGQTQRPFLGRGRYRLRIAYRSEGVTEPNAGAYFYMMPIGKPPHPVLRAALPPNEREYHSIISAPPGTAGSLFRWDVQYSGKGVFELHEVSLRKIEE
ncbi:MAG: hypothetical protein OD918_10360 [Gammaproteobacteria bacterium]